MVGSIISPTSDPGGVFLAVILSGAEISIERGRIEIPKSCMRASRKVAGFSVDFGSIF